MARDPHRGKCNRAASRTVLVLEKRALPARLPKMDIPATSHHPLSELLERVASGDLSAFEFLFRKCQNDVYGWIVRLVRDPATAEELTVETFWRIYKARGRLDPAANFHAWARRIATNLAIDHLKRRPPETALLIDFGREPPNPALSRETREMIAGAFRELPPKLQVVATLALIEQQAYADIARDLGISVSAVKLRVFRAVRLLRKKLIRMGLEP